MGLFGPPNVEKMKAKRDVEGLIKALDYQKEPGIRKAAAAALGQLGDARAVAPLIAALRDGYLRKTAAEALDHLGWQPTQDENGARYLIVMGEVDKCAAIGAPAVEPLILALKGGEEKFQEAVMQKLGEIADPRAFEPLIGMLNLSGFDYQHQRYAAIQALMQIITRQEDAALRIRAVGPLIAALLQDAGYGHVAQNALVRIGPPAVEPLVAILNDKNTYKAARYQVVEALGQIGDKRAVEPLLGAFYNDSDVRGSAATALGKLNDVRAVNSLIATLQKDNDFFKRKDAAMALGQFHDPHAQQALIAALQDDSGIKGYGTVRTTAAEVLGKIGDEQAMEPLIALLRNEAMQAAAAEALGKIVTRLEDATVRARTVAMLIPALQNVSARRTVADALDLLGWQPDQSASGAAYWVAKGQWDKCVAIGAAALEPLTDTLKSPYEDVRQAVVNSLEKLGWQPEENEAGAAYWVAKRAWDNCVGIGAPAVPALMAALEYETPEHLQQKDGYVRPAAAALIKLYQTGRLDEPQKQLILSQRARMMERHTDSHEDRACFAGESDSPHKDFHYDKGIAMEFPL